MLNPIEKYPPELTFQFKSYEKIPISIWENDKIGSQYIANKIVEELQKKRIDNEFLVLGLATGSSPIKIYQELINIHKEKGISFDNVITFNLDEYYPMKPNAIQSYVRFMHEVFFDHVDIQPENIHIPDGNLSLDEVETYCQNYEQKIGDLGGIDIQLLGIGRTGHIAFNEPGSYQNSITRLVRLDSITRRDAIKDFGEIEKVPYRALTMGIETILGANKIYIVAWGQHKAPIVKESIEGNINSHVPATYLQTHPNVEFLLDRSSAERLTKVETPWVVGACQWTDDMLCRAVVWLANRTNKPILKLTDKDYSDFGLNEIIFEKQNAYNVNIQIFNRLQRTITGWPGGKPNADDSTRPERALPEKKRVVIFSPHPDDDVISMGGTFLRLLDQNHDVHVAYQTSGNIAVHDYDTLRYIEFLEEYGDLSDFNLSSEELTQAKEYLTIQSDEESIPKEVLKINALIRRGEARAGARYFGTPNENIHFLDLPFYESGKNRKNPLSQKDIDIVKDLLIKIKPHQVYSAGDLADPHGTHKVCLDAILKAFDELQHESWIKDCWLWLYRGAWHEYEVYEIEMAVPLSPDELLKKRRAIFMHQSQKDAPPFPGNDEREFWQRAEERTRSTAMTYRKLGFAEYEAIEAFRRWKFDFNS